MVPQFYCSLRGCHNRTHQMDSGIWISFTISISVQIIVYNSHCTKISLQCTVISFSSWSRDRFLNGWPELNLSNPVTTERQGLVFWSRSSPDGRLLTVATNKNRGTEPLDHGSNGWIFNDSRDIIYFTAFEVCLK